MVLKTYDTARSDYIAVQPLTPESFAPFGDVISADHQLGQKKQSSANYGTAIKVHKVAAVSNRYTEAPSKKPATANWNIFRCSPPHHLFSKREDGSTVYLSKVLERHPFSTQMFLPIGADKNLDAYIVICAKSNKEDSLPDAHTVKAFICKGNQAVTYGVGTWHAPMVSLVDSLDFGVLIHENGVAEEDCQECYFNPGFRIVFPHSDSDAKL